MNRTLLATLYSWAATCLAQTGTYTWQLSSDGLSWQSAVNVPSGTTLHCRLLASWSGVAGVDIGFAQGEFDAMIIGPVSNSEVTNIRRTAPFAFTSQTLLASNYAAGVKIDTSTDTAPPGQGSGWVRPGQVPAVVGEFEFNRGNPCVIFSYDVIVHDDMVWNMILNPAAGRAMMIFTSGSGDLVRLNAADITINRAYTTTPAPAISWALIVFAPLTRPRRPSLECT